MNDPSRPLFPGLLAALALSAASCWAPTPTGGGPGRDGHAAHPVVLESSEPLDGVEVIRKRDAAKLRVAAQVLAGELDLFSAATHFRQINHEPPEFPQLGYLRLPGRTDEEKLCREVILWVKVRPPAGASPERVARVAAALEDALASREGSDAPLLGKGADRGTPRGQATKG